MSTPPQPTGRVVRDCAEQADITLAAIKKQIADFMRRYETDPAAYHRFMWSIFPDLEKAQSDVQSIIEIAKADAIRGKKNGESRE